MYQDNFLVVDISDEVIKDFLSRYKKTNLEHSSQIKDFDINVPVVVRGMGARKIIGICSRDSRNYFYIDTGYVGNLEKKKLWHRVVKNNVQHTNPNYNLPQDRFDKIVEGQDHLRFKSWRKNGRSILLVTPSEKPCKFYHINRDEWVDETVAQIRKNTDRPIIIRDKPIRKERVGESSIFKQFVDDDVFAVVTYNSIAAIEAISFGIPAFTTAPNAADSLCSKNLKDLDSPVYEEVEKVRGWQNWLGYCQYNYQDFMSGKVLDLIEKYDLR